MFIDLTNAFKYKQVLPFEVLNALGGNDEEIDVSGLMCERGMYIGNGTGLRIIGTSITFIKMFVVIGCKTEDMLNASNRLYSCCGVALAADENYLIPGRYAMSHNNLNAGYLTNGTYTKAGTDAILIQREGRVYLLDPPSYMYEGFFDRLNWIYYWAAIGRLGKIFEGKWDRRYYV